MIRLRGLSVVAGEFELRDLHLHVGSGEYLILRGRTGSGKTTVLEAICGLRQVTSGTIEVLGRDVTHLSPAARCIGYVPQDGALFPTHSVRQHLDFPLSLRGWDRRQRRDRVAELAALVEVDALVDRRPDGLSGGERQRVALGRALAFRPGALLLDEPLSAVDEDARQRMYELLKKVQRDEGVTALHVTHSREEADVLGDRVVVLANGRIPLPEPS